MRVIFEGPPIRVARILPNQDSRRGSLVDELPDDARLALSWIWTQLGI